MIEVPELLLILCAALLGAIAGSFLNALLCRYKTGQGMVWASSTSLKASRSRCMHCSHTLGPLDLIPIFSFLLLRGRCRYCSARLSPQYLLVEAAAVALAVLTYLAHPEPLTFAFWFVVWMTLLFVIAYDIRHTIIPWECSVLLAVLALGYLVSANATLVDVAAGPLLALPLFLISLFSLGTWMGWGDSALELSLGWLLGLTAGATALMLSFWIGGLVGIAALAARKGFTMKSEIPFAPFLIVGAGVVHFFHVDFFASLTALW